jgi:hypothetical protein
MLRPESWSRLTGQMLASAAPWTSPWLFPGPRITVLSR